MAMTCTSAFSQKIKGEKNQPLNGIAKHKLSNSEVSATLGFVNSLSGSKAMFDLLFDFPIMTGGTAGVETDGQYLYITRWNSNMYYKYNLTGTLVDSFSVTGAGQTRDLAYDGQYFYGGTGSNIIYKMNFTTHTLVSTITCQSGVQVRHIAYDPINNAFWCGNWDTDFYLVDMTGNTINTIPATTHGQTDIYGSAYDNYTIGGPYLWLYRQTSANANDLEQVNLNTGMSTGLTFDVTSVVTGIDPTYNSAGGLCISKDVVPNKAALIGVSQNMKLWAIELKSLQVFPNDVGITSLTAPTSSQLLTNSDSIKVVIHNYDSISHTDIPVNYVIDGGPVVRDTLHTAIPQYANANFKITIPYDFSIPGHIYQIKVYTSLAGDGNTVNDTLNTTVTNRWDVAPVSIDIPSIVGVGANTPQATVINNGTMTSTFNVTMHFTGYSSTKTVTNLLPGASQQVTFDLWNAVLGNYNVEVYTTLLADSVPANDTLSKMVDVQSLVKVYGYVAYDPATTGALPEGPAFTYLQTPQNIVSLADQTGEAFVGAATWGTMNKWYGVTYGDNDLITIDTLTGTKNIIGNLGIPFEGMTFDPTTSTLYGVSNDGTYSNLYMINPGSAVATLIGQCTDMLLINLACSQSGVLYAVCIDDDNLYTINKTTGAATIVGPIGFNASYAQDMEVNQNTGICYMAAYNDDNSTGELRTVDLTTGATTLIGEFLHNIELTGFAIPFPVVVPAIDASVISVDNPQTSCNLDQENLEIKVMNFGSTPIVNMPVAYTVNGGTPVAASLNGTLTSGQSVAFTFPLPVDLSADDDYVIKVFSTLSGDANYNNDTVTYYVSNLAPKTIPYSVGFEPAEDLAGCSVIDNNSDGYSWFITATGGNTDPYCMEYSYNSSSPADDWFISSCVNFDASKTYNLKYYYKAQSASYPEKLKVWLGDDNTVAALTTQVDDKSNIINTSYNLSSVNFTVPVTGVYYLGWQCYSATDMYNLFVDDINISDVTGVEENNIDINLMIMPNPAKDQFTVLSSENNAVITVTNTLGAVVYSVNANSNKVIVNTTEFSSGLYFVKVETENGSSVKKIMISK